MKKNIWPRFMTGALMVLSLGAITCTALTFSWFLGPNVSTKDDDYLGGNIGLREYFFSGDGSEEKPYEIVSPIHLYNLSRLQNLGIFPEKTYFQVGHTFDIEGVPSLRCIDHYDNEGNPIYTEYLDMGTFSSENTVYTIGGEGAPFVGSINGNGIPIKNLKVSGNPEDIGVFGYVSHEGYLEGLVFDNLQITSLGYSNDTSSPENKLFSEDIDDIFTSSSYLATDVSLDIYRYNSLAEEYYATNLTKRNGTTGTAIDSLNADGDIITGTMYYNGYFKPTFPNIVGDQFTYSITSSSPILKKAKDVNIQGCSVNDLVLDLSLLEESSSFNSTANAQVNAKIYLSASCVVDGFTFTRVIQSYSLEIYNNQHLFSDKQLTARIYCDYLQSELLGDYATNYHHGTNIGLIAGHVDGSLKNCYVFNGKFKFNDSQYHPLAAESDTALVGEIGKNVSNDIDPELGLKVNGDIGVMNFSKIYGMIRSDATAGTVIKGGRLTPYGASAAVNYISYKKFVNTESIDKFIDYLRYYTGLKDDYEFITKVDTNMGANAGAWHDYTIPSTVPADFNSVDFLWNKVISDDDDTDRGLGVFKIVSTYNGGAKTGTYGEYVVNDIGSCRINNGSAKTKVYFSTAEYDHTVSDQPKWGTGDADIDPLRATSIPSYSDLLSYSYPFSRDYNYVFELDLSQMADAGGKDYMWNTDSDFLANYLSSILIDKYGKPVSRRNDRFGFMFRSSENEILSSLSSYMPVGKPGTKSEFTDDDGVTKYYPSNSIVFRIENPNGANVSVVGNNDDITIYKYDPSTSSESGEHKTTALYSMKSANTNGTMDSFRYFTYDVATGATGTQTVTSSGDMKDNSALYGHIFKLPQGDYVLGARNSTANIYFLAVQGQTEGTIGTTDIVTLQDYIEDVEFLLEAPTFTNYPSGFTKALFTYNGNFNTVSGEIVMDVVTIGENKYMRLTFVNSPVFITHLLSYNRHPNQIFYINNEGHSGPSYTYEPS